MSAIQMIVANLQGLSEADRAQVLGHFAKNTVAPAKQVDANKEVEKKQNANKGKPTCYSDFSKKIMEDQRDAVAAFKLANPELKGAHLSFVGTYKKDHPEEYTAYEVAWKLAHPKEPVAEPVAEPVPVAVPVAEPVPAVKKARKPMTEETKAAAALKRAATKAKKAADHPKETGSPKEKAE